MRRILSNSVKVMTVTVTVRRCLNLLNLNSQCRRVCVVTSSRRAHESDRKSSVDPLEKMDQLDTCKQLFTGKEITDLYAKYRQTLPMKSFEMIHDFCKETCTGNDLAVDVGCGPGISSLPLTKYYKMVIGVDVSQSQISNAPTDVPGLSFRVGTAEDLSFLPSSSVDLVTAGVALHWFQLDKFYAELDRILKPGGSFVAYTIGLPMAEDHPEVNDYVNHVHYKVLDGYWSDRRRLALEEKIKSLPSPYEGETRLDDFVVRNWTMDQMIGYISTWSGLNQYIKANPDHDLKGDLRKKLCEMCDLDSSTVKDKMFKFESPTHFIMAHKPGGQQQTGSPE